MDLRPHDAEEYHVGLPVPVSERTSVDLWVAALRMAGNGTFAAADSDVGSVIMVTARDAVRLRAAIALRPTSPDGLSEEYIHARWTTQATPRRTEAPVELPLVGGNDLANITIEYLAVSGYCGRYAYFSGEPPRANGTATVLDGTDWVQCQ